MNKRQLTSRAAPLNLCALAMLLSIVVESGAQEPASLISIVEPSAGAVVAPGQTVNIRVEVDPSLLPGSVLIMGGNVSENPISSKILSGPPFEGPLIIPLTASGRLELVVSVTNPERGVVDLTETSLTVIPVDTPIRIEATKLVRLSHPTHVNELDRQLSVIGYYPNEVKRDLSAPVTGTAFQSLTPDVVLVDSSGQLTTVAPGYGYVLVENHQATAFTQVYVEGTGGIPPAIDRTASAALTRSGFRKEPQSGLYAQRIGVKNTGTLPCPKALRLVVTDLPEGVAVHDRYGYTKYVEPVGAPIVAVDLAGRDDFLLPGASAVAILKFSNPEGKPITYSLKLFCGGRL